MTKELEYRGYRIVHENDQWRNGTCLEGSFTELCKTLDQALSDEVDSCTTYRIRWNHHRHRNPSVAQRYDNQWHGMLHASYDLKDVHGSSLGRLYAAAYGATPQEALNAAAEQLDYLIDKEIEFSLSRTPRAKPLSEAAAPPKASKADIDELSKLLGL